MNRMKILVGRGSRKTARIREANQLVIPIEVARPLRSPSRAQDFANTIARPDQERPVPTTTSGSANSSPQRIQGSNTTMTLRNRGSFRSLALPVSWPKTSLDLTRHKPCESAGSFGSLALPVSRPKTFRDLTHHKPCETAGSFRGLAYQ
jgi:hypothetical protein